MTTSKPRMITKNTYGGFYGSAAMVDSSTAHREYNKMHSQAKKATLHHLYNEKKPNIVVRDFLDSSHGRHLHNMHVSGKADEKYIRKSFRDFKKKYDPELFEEEANDQEKMKENKKFSRILKAKKSLVGREIE